jgi:hypothetical protein
MIALTLLSVTVLACHDVTLHVPGSDLDLLRANVVDAKYLSVGTHYYVHLLAVQGGWSGWKEHHFSKDSLVGLQIVLRLPARPSQQLYSLPGPVEGYVFAETSMGIIAAWRIAGGTLATEFSARGLILEADVQIDPTYQASRVHTNSGVPKTLIIKRTRLRADLGVPANILAAANLEIEPRLKEWRLSSLEVK